ncbi:MAG: DUF4234 domain-containing protein [Candidatus Heimdallarchaeota archaeon]|nr:DUF4234 domain-containing protein [Candidatus Heimdallarchaeota archaeon]
MSRRPPLEQRNFWLWMVLSICTFGICGLIYSIFNIIDLNNLAKYPRPKKVPSPEIDDTLLIIIILLMVFTGIGGIVLVFLKFQRLHEYIKYHPKKQSYQVPSGLKVLLVNILAPIIGGIIILIVFVIDIFVLANTGPNQFALVLPIVGAVIFGIIMLILVIYNIIVNYRWQEAYNERARMLMGIR